MCGEGANIAEAASEAWSEGELATALRNYEDFHRLPFGSATVEQLQSSSAKIGGWLLAGPHFAIDGETKATTSPQPSKGVERV
jgi:hypothetical protein